MSSFALMPYDQRVLIKKCIDALQQSGFICEATYPELFTGLKHNEALLTALNQALVPLMMTASDGLGGQCFFYVPMGAGADAQHVNQVLKSLNKEIRFVVEFRRLVSRLTGQGELRVGASIRFGPALATIDNQMIVFEMLKDCFTQIKRAGKTDAKSMLELVFDCAVKMSLLVRPSNTDVHLITARLLYVQALIDHIFEHEQLKISEPETLSILQGDLL